jgi:hypothetical protein
MTEQFKALRLADALDRNGYDAEMARNMNQAAAELRRLYAENERLGKLCDDFMGQLMVLRAEKQMREFINKAKENT